MVNRASIQLARSAKQRALELLGDLPGLVGIGLCKVGDGYGLKVNLEAAPPRRARVPKSIDGVPVNVQVVGRLRPR